jgi:hypothetical protein
VLEAKWSHVTSRLLLIIHLLLFRLGKHKLCTRCRGHASHVLEHCFRFSWSAQYHCRRLQSKNQSSLRFYGTYRDYCVPMVLSGTEAFLNGANLFQRKRGGERVQSQISYSKCSVSPLRILSRSFTFTHLLLWLFFLFFMPKRHVLLWNDYSHFLMLIFRGSHTILCSLLNMLCQWVIYVTPFEANKSTLRSLNYSTSAIWLLKVFWCSLLEKYSR